MIRPEYNPNIFPHWSEHPIRFRDLDPLNHVNNALYNTFYEEARIQFIQTLPEMLASMKEGKSFVLVNLEIQFLKPVTYPGKLVIGTGVKSIGNSSISGFQAMYVHSDKTLVSIAESTGVWFDIDKQQPVALPDISNSQDLLINQDSIYQNG